MVRPIILASLLLTAVFARAEAIDFTPKLDVQMLDGMAVSQMVFRQGPKKIGYTAPGGWRIAGRGPLLTLTPPNATQAQVTVECLTEGSALPFSDARLDLLRGDAAKFLPAKAENVAKPVEKLNDFHVDRHEVFESTAAYSYYGQAFKLGVVYVNAGENLLRCRVLCRASDFDAVYGAFRRSLFSWNVL